MTFQPNVKFKGPISWPSPQRVEQINEGVNAVVPSGRWQEPAGCGPRRGWWAPMAQQTRTGHPKVSEPRAGAGHRGSGQQGTGRRPDGGGSGRTTAPRKGLQAARQHSTCFPSPRRPAACPARAWWDTPRKDVALAGACEMAVLEGWAQGQRQRH